MKTMITEGWAMNAVLNVLTAAVLGICYPIASCSALELKHDILGFSPDMPLSSFNGKLLELKCKDDNCQLSDGVLQFRHTVGLPEDHIKQVAYQFKSGLKPREMISYIAKQYGVITAKADIGDIGYAMGRYEDLPLVGSRLMTGGPICRWRLSKGQTLSLTLDVPGDVFTYILYLTDGRLDEAEATVTKNKKDQALAKIREINRKPRL